MAFDRYVVLDMSLAGNPQCDAESDRTISMACGCENIQKEGEMEFCFSNTT
jgi:hypothetical protein